MKCAKQMYPQANPDTDKIHTIPYLDELLSDKDFYEFLDTLYHYVEGLHGMTEEMKEQFHGLDIEGYFIWQLQMFVQKFIQNEIKKLGLDITMERYSNNKKCQHCRHNLEKRLS